MKVISSCFERRQGLPTKTKSDEMRQVRKLEELRSRETVRENGKICFLCHLAALQRQVRLYSAAVVLYLKYSHATILEGDANTCSPSIQAFF